MWRPTHVQTMDAMDATIRQAAAQMLTIISAHGFDVPSKWREVADASN